MANPSCMFEKPFNLRGNHSAAPKTWLDLALLFAEPGVLGCTFRKHHHFQFVQFIVAGAACYIDFQRSLTGVK